MHFDKSLRGFSALGVVTLVLGMAATLNRAVFSVPGSLVHFAISFLTQTSKAPPHRAGSAPSLATGFHVSVASLFRISPLRTRYFSRRSGTRDMPTTAGPSIRHADAAIVGTPHNAERFSVLTASARSRPA